MVGYREALEVEVMTASEDFDHNAVQGDENDLRKQGYLDGRLEGLEKALELFEDFEKQKSANNPNIKA